MDPSARIADLEAEVVAARAAAKEAERQKGEVEGEVHELRVHLASIEHQIDLMRGSYEELARLKASRSFALAQKLSQLAARMRR